VNDGFVDVAAVLWARLPVEWRVAAEGAWVEGRYALVNAADRAECVAWLAGGWGWTSPSATSPHSFEHATRARRATKLAEFAAEALSDAGEALELHMPRSGAALRAALAYGGGGWV
jgi:hypothetical protein